LHYVEYLTTHATLKPTTRTKTRNGFGILKGKVTIADDFDAPLEEFADYQ
jgi:hypothetical protein